MPSRPDRLLMQPRLLTISVAIERGIDVLVVLSVIILALLGFGILGALTSPPPDG